MAEFDADAFADSLPGWDPEARAAFLASLDDDEAPELPLLAESVDEMDPAMVEALMQLRDGGEPPSELAVDAKNRGNQHFKRAASTKNKLFYREAAKEYSDGLALCVAARSEAEQKEKGTLREALLERRLAEAEGKLKASPVERDEAIAALRKSFQEITTRLHERTTEIVTREVRLRMVAEERARLRAVEAG